MSISATQNSAGRLRTFERSVESGIIAGIASSIVNMMMLAMAGAILGVGAAAPFYAIIGPLDQGTAITAHNAALDTGDIPTFQQESFLLGLGVCLILGAISGVIFTVGMRKYPVRGPLRYVVGALHGIIMMCLFYLGVLGAFRAAGELNVDAMSLAQMLGWPAMVGIHAIHGVVLAAVMRTQLTSTDNLFAASMPTET
jgi:hypothetical protein